MDFVTAVLLIVFFISLFWILIAIFAKKEYKIPIAVSISSLVLIFILQAFRVEKKKPVTPVKTKKEIEKPIPLVITNEVDGLYLFKRPSVTIGLLVKYTPTTEKELLELYEKNNYPTYELRNFLREVILEIDVDEGMEYIESLRGMGGNGWFKARVKGLTGWIYSYDLEDRFHEMRRE